MKIILFKIFLISFVIFENLFSKEENLIYNDSYTLDNGMKVVLIPDYNNPIINIRIDIDKGRLNSPKNKPSLAKDTFTLLKEGTAKYSNEEIRNKLLSFGNKEMNFDSYWMSLDRSLIDNICLKEDTEQCIELFSEVVRHPTFKNLDFLSTSFFKLLSFSLGRLFHEYTIWDHASYLFINHTKKPDPYYYYKASLKKWHKQYINPKNITLSISGDFNTLYIKNLVNKYFDDWKVSEKDLTYFNKINHKINITKTSGIKINFLEDQGSKNVDVLIWKKLGDLGKFFHNAEVATNIFRVSRLPIVEESILQSRKIDYSWANGGQMPHVSINIEELNYSLLDIYYSNLISSFKKPITRLELEVEKSEQNKWYKKSEQIYDLKEKNDYFMYLRQRNNGKLVSSEEVQYYINIIDSVSLEDINRAAKEVFDPNNFIMVVRGNRDSCKTFLSQFDDVTYYKDGDKPK